MITVFPGRRHLAREYMEVLFRGVGRVIPRSPRIDVVSTAGPLAVVSDFHDFARRDQQAFLRNFRRLCLFWWNDEQELLRSAEEEPELLCSPSITHCFFFNEPVRRLEAIGASSIFVKPVFASPARLAQLSKVVGGSLPRYLVAMEVDWSSSTDGGASRSRYEEANESRRQFLQSVATRHDFLFVGRDLRQSQRTSLPTIPQRTFGGPQVMPLLMLLSRGVIELGSKSARSSITPRMGDALSVGTTVHALSFGDQDEAIEGVQWYACVDDIASIAPPRKVTWAEREGVATAFNRTQRTERMRVLKLIKVGGCREE